MPPLPSKSLSTEQLLKKCQDADKEAGWSFLELATPILLPCKPGGGQPLIIVSKEGMKLKKGDSTDVTRTSLIHLDALEAVAPHLFAIVGAASWGRFAVGSALVVGTIVRSPIEERQSKLVIFDLGRSMPRISPLASSTPQLQHRASLGKDAWAHLWSSMAPAIGANGYGELADDTSLQAAAVLSGVPRPPLDLSFPASARHLRSGRASLPPADVNATNTDAEKKMPGLNPSDGAEGVGGCNKGGEGGDTSKGGGGETTLLVEEPLVAASSKPKKQKVERKPKKGDKAGMGGGDKAGMGVVDEEESKGDASGGLNKKAIGRNLSFIGKRLATEFESFAQGECEEAQVKKTWAEWSSLLETPGYTPDRRNTSVGPLKQKYLELFPPSRPPRSAANLAEKIQIQHSRTGVVEGGGKAEALPNAGGAVALPNAGGGSCMCRVSSGSG